ncbi:hypothetical protein SLEP1_g20886 [Rubroshorea leprosula]|uniref:Uncharacterized protein n=1 Tax=Rubroshorea leprosula TaxID=152421 RepID=A0AAV5JET5_9ROSI|nr:hypothetical protein SLEP1_g20886 [Rubroshorea leprosula]
MVKGCVWDCCENKVLCFSPVYCYKYYPHLYHFLFTLVSPCWYYIDAVVRSIDGSNFVAFLSFSFLLSSLSGG